MTLLVTPTLLDAIDWFNKCPANWKEKAFNDLSNTLNRIYPEPMPAPMKRGIDFEDAVYANANKDEYGGSELFHKVCELVKGADYQKKAKNLIEIDGVEYCLYGKIDVFYDDWIIDIKTTGNYKGAASYLTKWQHHFYTCMTKVKDFTYLVVEMPKDYSQTRIIAVHEVEYQSPSTTYERTEIVDGVRGMRAFFDEHESLRKAYITTFNKYNR